MAAPEGREAALRAPSTVEFELRSGMPAWMTAAHGPFGAPGLVRSYGAALQVGVSSEPQ